MPKSGQVIRSVSHRNEDLSKRKLELVMEPWVISWIQKDYGFDATIQITTPINGSADLKLERNSFFLQLKAKEKIRKTNGEISYQLPVKKVQQWIGHNVPVLFVLYDVNGQDFFYTWMDTDLLEAIEHANNAWASQKTISVKLKTTNQLTAEVLTDLHQKVINFKRPTITWIEPGRFFSLKEECHRSIDLFKKIAYPFPFASMAKQLETLSTEVEKSIYRIAITGLSRVGKSSLINSLLHKEICPVGFYQTTAVPIEILPSAEQKIQVLFLNGSKKMYEYNNGVIEQYASQDHNPENEKKVARVSIFVNNRNLQRGISVFDVPGLDDSNDEIVNYTLETVSKVNAILYVIDASPAQNGGFIFKKDYKQHLLSFGQSIEKIFLVFNKADGLSEDKLLSLKERVKKDLEKLKLYESIAAKIYYTSAKHRYIFESIDKVSALEEDIWSFIINENRGGIARLTLLNKAIAKSLYDFQNILKARLIDADKRTELKTAIQRVEAKIPQLTQEIKTRLLSHDKVISGLLTIKKETMLKAFEEYLESLPLDRFPDKLDVKEFILLHLNQAMTEANIEYAQGMNEIKNYTDGWIEQNLQQIRNILSSNAANRVIDFTELEQFEPPAMDVFSSVGVGLIGWLLGILVLPEVAMLTGIGTFLANLFMSQEQQKAARILKTIKNCRKVCDKSYGRLSEQYKELAQEQIVHVAKYLDEKLKLYFDDLNLQIKQLPDISPQEKTQYKQVFDKIEELNNKLLKFDMEIMHY